MKIRKIWQRRMRTTPRIRKLVDLRCHLWQLENINDFIIKSRYYDYEGIFIGFYYISASENL